MNQKIRRGLQAGLFVALILATVSGLSAPTQGQESIHRAEAVVLVNSASSDYADFAQYIRPYLDHFGIPYTTLDIATTPVPPSIADYALILISHRLGQPHRRATRLDGGNSGSDAGSGGGPQPLCRSDRYPALPSGLR